MATHYFTGCSLDGFIADSDHSLSWLLTRDIDPAGPMHYEAFVAEIGALAMGATTYRWILDHHPGEWFYSQPSWVFTHREFPEPPGDVRFTADPVPDVHAAMTAAADGRDLWLVGGGDLVGQFHDAGLLDEIWVQFAPVTLGGGAPFLPRRIELELLDVQRNRDFLCGRYAVVKN